MTKASNEGDLDPNHVELLREYEINQLAAQSLENTVWQSASVLGIGSAAGLILTIGKDTALHAVLLVGVFVVGSSFAWWMIAKRWWTVQHTKFTRMLHIEQELKRAGQTSYLRYLDDLTQLLEQREGQKPHPSRARPTGSPRLQYEIPPNAARDLWRINCPGFERRGPKEILEFLPWFNLLIWLTYFTIEVVISAG